MLVSKCLRAGLVQAGQSAACRMFTSLREETHWLPAAPGQGPETCGQLSQALPGTSLLWASAAPNTVRWATGLHGA